LGKFKIRQKKNLEKKIKIMYNFRSKYLPNNYICERIVRILFRKFYKKKSKMTPISMVRSSLLLNVTEPLKLASF